MVNSGVLGVFTAIVSAASASSSTNSAFSGGFMRRHSSSKTGYPEGSFFALTSDSTALCPAKNDGLTNFAFSDNPDIPHCVEIETFFDKDGVTASGKRTMFFNQGVFDYSQDGLKLEDARVIVHPGCNVKINYCHNYLNGKCENAGELKQDASGVYWLRAPPADRSDVLPIDTTREAVIRVATKIEVGEAPTLQRCVTFETNDLPSEKIKTFDLDITTGKPIDFETWTGDLGYAFGAIGVHALTVRPGCVAELSLTSPDQTDDDGAEAWRVFLSPGSYPSLRAFVNAKYPTHFGPVAKFGNAISVKGATIHSLVSFQVPGVVDIASAPRYTPLCLVHHNGALASSMGLKPCEDVPAKTGWLWTPSKGQFRPFYDGEPLNQCLHFADTQGVASGNNGECGAVTSCGKEGCNLTLGECGNIVSRKIGPKKGLAGVAELTPGQIFSTPNLKCYDEGTHDLGSVVLAFNGQVADEELAASTARTQGLYCLTAGADPLMTKKDFNKYALYPTTDDNIVMKPCGSVAQITSSNCGVARRQLFRLARGPTMQKYQGDNFVEEVDFDAAQNIVIEEGQENAERV